MTIDPGKAELYRLYHGPDQLSLAGIGERLGCSAQYVFTLMEKYKIKRRTKKVAARVGQKHGRFSGPVPKVGREEDRLVS